MHDTKREQRIKELLWRWNDSANLQLIYPNFTDYLNFIESKKENTNAR